MTTTVRIPLHTAKQHFGVSRVRGTRPRNEDNYQAGVIDVPIFAPAGPKIKDDPLSPDPPGEPNVFYFGVFDGHGGEDASVYLKDRLHQYIEETSKLLNPTNASYTISSQTSRKYTIAEQSDASREECARIQNDLVNNWKDTVGGYFRRFRPNFGTTKTCGVSGNADIGAVLVYAFLKADLDFITSTPPWFLTPEPETPAEPSQSFKGGSTASTVLISTS